MVLIKTNIINKLIALTQCGKTKDLSKGQIKHRHKQSRYEKTDKLGISKANIKEVDKYQS